MFKRKSISTPTPVDQIGQLNALNAFIGAASFNARPSNEPGEFRVVILWGAGEGSAYHTTAEEQLRSKFPHADDATMREAMRYVHARCRLAMTGDAGGAMPGERKRNWVQSWRD